jgi:hypothetical protein
MDPAELLEVNGISYSSVLNNPRILFCCLSAICGTMNISYMEPILALRMKFYEAEWGLHE